MENNKDINLSKPKIYSSLKSLKNTNTKKIKKETKKEYLDSFYTTEYIDAYFNKKELNITH